MNFEEFDFVNFDIDNATPEEAEKFYEFTLRFIEQSGGADAARMALLPEVAKEDSPRGFEAYFEYMHAIPLHKEGLQWVENAYKAHAAGKGLAQEVHREGGKTTVFSKFFLSFRIGHDPHKTNAVIRINDTKANQTTAGVAQIIEFNPKWREIFPHVVPDKAKGWGEKGYNVKVIDPETGDKVSWWDEKVTESPDDPTFVGYGWESGSVIGSRFNGVCIVDDIHDADNVKSPKTMSKIREFVTETLEYCLMTGSWEIWNFTPWTQGDVYAYIKSTGEYIHSKTPVMVEVNEGDPGAELWPKTPMNPDYPEAGDIPLSGRYWVRYWPEMWPWSRLTSKFRKTKSLGFARQMLLDLEAAKGRVLMKEWLHKMDPIESESWPTIFGVDYASSRDKTEARGRDRDYFTIAILKAIPRGGLLLLDGYRARVSKGEALSKVASYASVYPNLHIVGVESIGGGRDFYNDLILINDVYGKPLPLFEIKTHGKRSKGERFENWLAPRFQMARVWVSSVSTPFIEQFEEEWLTYPSPGHDDTLDGVYMGVMAGEGFMPNIADRTHGDMYKVKPVHPYAIGRW